MTGAERQVALGFPSLGERELAAVRDVFASGWVAGQGPATARLEAAFAARCGVAHAVAVNNCTAGLHLSLLALGVGPGDEVIVADYTFPATGHAVRYCGARPVFADVRADTATLDPRALDPLVTDRTRGIIAVDALGQCADYDEIEAFAAARNLFVLEDAACSAGGAYRGRTTGSFGDIACFSLHGRKGITCGEGGVVVTDRADLAERVRKWSCFGMQSAFARQHSDELAVPVFDELGYNYKLADVLAAVALVQLERLDELLAARERVAVRYDAAFSDLRHVTPPARLADRRHVFQTYAIAVEPPLDRDQLALALRRHGVQCNIGTYASHVQPVYRDAALGGDAPTPCSVSASLFRTHLALPMHAELTDADTDYVIELVTREADRPRRRAGA